MLFFHINLAGKPLFMENGKVFYKNDWTHNNALQGILLAAKPLSSDVIQKRICVDGKITLSNPVLLWVRDL
jgi:hypothetical protein